MTIKSCKLVVKDQCNVSFVGLDPKTRRVCNKVLKFFIHAARHTPAYKLGRWDGCVSFFAINGNTYLNTLEKVLPIIIDAGYEIEIEDLRPENSFEFPNITSEYFQDYLDGVTWPLGHQKAGEKVILRDYQVEVIEAAIANLQSVQNVSTGAGKCVTYATKVNIEIDETSEFYDFLKKKNLI
jgi:hypothetical protein